eukprot:13175629-Alexandrium_andersonii.AAC.1
MRPGMKVAGRIVSASERGSTEDRVPVAHAMKMPVMTCFWTALAALLSAALYDWSSLMASHVAGWIQSLYGLFRGGRSPLTPV